MATKKKTIKKPAKKAARSAAKKAVKTPAPAHDPREQFLDSFNREHGVTAKVLRSLPAGQSGFKPHERSTSAHGLAWNFVMEQRLMLKALNNEPFFGGSQEKPPEDINAIYDVFEREAKTVVAKVQSTSPAQLAEAVQFPSGPGTMGTWTKAQFLWYMLMDQIHHRGQLSVYVRMAGGRVPSIYGPSADEPWF